MEPVAALDCVDLVTWFDDPDPLALIEAIRPDVLVKEGDYQPEDVIGHELADVVIVDLLPGHTTSRTVERLTAV